jgi:hypothetical protein
MDQRGSNIWRLYSQIFIRSIFILNRWKRRFSSESDAPKRVLFTNLFRYNFDAFLRFFSFVGVGCLLMFTYSYNSQFCEYNLWKKKFVKHDSYIEISNQSCFFYFLSSDDKKIMRAVFILTFVILFSTISVRALLHSLTFLQSEQ